MKTINSLISSMHKQINLNDTFNFYTCITFGVVKTVQEFYIIVNKRDNKSKFYH